jgi:4-amino-4-deoxy-L-arabinose transferase-like glycosyltransferase
MSASRNSRIELLVLLLLSIALRITWWHFGPTVIENEGCYYARVGENLAAGRGYMGIHEMGAQLIYPPLYPALIAAGVRAGMSAETAGRLASLLFGALLPLIAYLLAARLYGSWPGRFAGLLAAIHPLLVTISVAVLTESIYSTLTLLTTYAVIRLLQTQERRWAGVAGLSLGLAYLCRPEAIVLTVGMTIIAVAGMRADRKLATSRAALLVSVFAVFALPYVAFLWSQTGQLRFEAKTADHAIITSGVAAGLSPGEIYFAVDSDLVEHGASNTSDLQQLLTPQPPLRRRAGFAIRRAMANVPQLLRALNGLQLGQPLLAVFVALGLFSLPWSRERFRLELPLAMLPALNIVAILAAGFFKDRFLYPALPALIVWAGAGVDQLRRWMLASLPAIGMSGKRAAFFTAGALVVCAGWACAAATMGVRGSDELSQEWSPNDDAEIARWLREQKAIAKIMDTRPTLAFYARGVLVTYPWTDTATALRYVEKKQVDFLILRDSDKEKRPYLAGWLKLAPEQLSLVHDFSGSAGVTYVYKLR